MRKALILKAQFKRFGLALLTLFILLCFTVVKGQNTPYLFTHEDSLRGSLNPARTAFDVYFYHLNIIIDPDKHTITGTNSISFVVKHPSDSIQIDLFQNYSVLGVMYDNTPQRVTRDGDHIFIHFNDVLKTGEKRTIEVHYTGTPPEAKNAPWDGGFVWSKDSLKRTWVGVACEGLGASSWWPCKDHLSDKPDSMRITIGVPEAFFCVSNGQLKSIKNLYTGYYQYEWVVTYPINTYDVTVNIGKYERMRYRYHSVAGDLDLDYFVLDYHVKQAESYFQNQVKPMLDCFERYFGPYPFTRDGYALVETQYWGMEHQGAIAYGNHFALNRQGFDYIIVHESAHEWWGNSLSVPDQAEMWLHESFATYAEALYIECRGGKDLAQAYLNEQRRNIVNQFPVVGPSGVNFYKRSDNDIYYKGAWMLHTLRNVINNDSLWFDMIYGFQQKYKYGIVTTGDFIKFVQEKYQGDAKVKKLIALDDHYNLNFNAFFDTYLEQPMLPTLIFETRKKGGVIEITYSWKNAAKGFNMPVDLNIKGLTFRIFPSEIPKTIKLDRNAFSQTRIKNVKPRNVKVMTDHFLIDVEP
jgi:aminopeptidase N